MHQNKTLTTIFKLFLLIFITKIFTISVYAGNGVSDSAIGDTTELSVYDVSRYENKELQIYLYHVNALLEYQEHQIRKYESVIYVLIGVIALIITIIVLNKVSKKYEKSFKVIRAKKYDMVPAAVLMMIFKHWNIKESYKVLQHKFTKEAGEDMVLDDFLEAGSNYGIDFFTVKGNLQELISCLEVPVIVLFNNHMAVLYKTKKQRIFIADPYYGYIELNPYYFVNNWFADKSKEIGEFIVPIPGKIQNKSTRGLLEHVSGLKKLEKRQWKQYKLIQGIAVEEE